MDTLDDGPALAVPAPRQLRDRASDFRIILGARQEADGILAEATEVRRDAGRQAELLVAEAEALSRDLTDQARSVLDQATGEARERAEGILAIARASAEDIRRRADAQVVTDRDAFLGEIEATIRTLETTLRRARGSVADAEGAVDLLRTEMAGTLPEAGAGAPETTTAPAPAAQGDEGSEESVELRPLGWLFRADRS